VARFPTALKGRPPAQAIDLLFRKNREQVETSSAAANRLGARWLRDQSRSRLQGSRESAMSQNVNLLKVEYFERQAKRASNKDRRAKMSP
jgi:hypothetical protein